MSEPLVVRVAPELAARVRSQERFNAAFARVGTLRHELIVAPERCEADGDGGLRCVYAPATRVDLVPGELKPTDVAVLGVKMARALSALHAAGYAHGAITADAVVQTTERGPLLGRVGLFTALSEGGVDVRDAALGLSASAYVAPEVQKGKAPDERSDLFSLGSSLYELLTGKPPYGGRTTSFVMASVLVESDPDGRSSGAVAGPVVDALLRAIERAPEDRWPTAEAFAQSLTFDGTPEPDAAPARKQSGSLSAILRSWFPARRSRG